MVTELQALTFLRTRFFRRLREFERRVSWSRLADIRSRAPGPLSALRTQVPWSGQLCVPRLSQRVRAQQQEMQQDILEAGTKMFRLNLAG